MLKSCKLCLEVKPEIEFYINKDKRSLTSYLSSNCKKCAKLKSRQQFDTNKEDLKDKRRIRQYGISSIDVKKCL